MGRNSDRLYEIIREKRTQNHDKVNKNKGILLRL